MNTKPKHSKSNEALNDAAHLVVITQNASVNDLRIRLGITYKRTREVMEQLNQSGIVGPLSENETAEVLITNYADLESAMPIIKE